MSSLLYVFTRPFFYLFIKDPSGDKKWIDWLCPLFFSLVLSVVLLLCDHMPAIVGENGIFENMKGFLQIMPGFYLTALAAIATFANSNLDLLLPDPAPTISIMYNGEKIPNLELTRRRFLNYLFGYLTAISLLLYFFIIIAELFEGTNLINNPIFQIWIKPIVFFMYTVFVFQMLFITMFGLYQLCERIHQVEQEDNNG